jgi:hypothetical protein
MCRISEDGAYSTCVAIDVDECRSLDAIEALPTDREGGISLVDVDRFGVAIPGQSCSELVGRVKQPRIARFAREQDELTDADHASGVVGCPTLKVAEVRRKLLPSTYPDGHAPHIQDRIARIDSVATMALGTGQKPYLFGRQSASYRDPLPWLHSEHRSQLSVARPSSSG